ncbi:MAG: peroxide stress protein YaaA [Flavobacteriales bacterium]|nr:peroxide stress protein YaaA [Flavobacteriales bacterium]
MLILLSPAKDLAKETPVIKGTTTPVLLEDAATLVAKLKTLSAKKLADLMDLSLKLGELNRERYAQWSTPFTTKNARPAAFTFNGEVYRGLDARSLTADDLRFAQHHLRILSGLYGVLRPLDLMQDYRLMMGTPFGVGKAKNLYAFWGDRITDVLKKDLKSSGSDTVVNLASSEYFKAVDAKKLGTMADGRQARIITPIFKDKVGSGYKVVMVFAKQQRGAMARHIIQHRLLKADDLKAYDGDGYRFVPEESTADEWLFLRDKKPAKAPAKLAGGRIR